MRTFNETWDYLTTGSNWTGADGIWTLLVQQLLISLTALTITMVLAQRMLTPWTRGARA